MSDEQAANDQASAELVQAHEAEQAASDQASAELVRQHEAEQAAVDQASAELVRQHEAEQAAVDQASAELLRQHAEQEARERQQAQGPIDEAASAELVQAHEQQAIDRRNSRFRFALGILALLSALALFLIITLLRAGANGANPTVGTSQARILVDATDSDGRTTKFESTVRLTRDEIGGLNEDTLSGRGTGPFFERFVSDQCTFTITWSGDVGVEVVARLAEGRVEVAIEGPVTESGGWPGEECQGGTYYAPNRGATELSYSCDFNDVDFTLKATYRAPTPEEAPNPYGCTLEFDPQAP